MTDRPPDVEPFSRLLGPLYASAAEPAGRQNFPEAPAGVFKAKPGLFRLIDERGPGLRAGGGFNPDPDLQRVHREYRIARDPIVEDPGRLPDGFDTGRAWT